MVGEKYINPDHYLTGEDPGDDQNMYLGVDWDVNRWARLDEPLTPDTAKQPHPRRFGSAHGSVCFFLFCDGSVRGMSFTLDAETHRRLGNRQDGLVVNLSTL